MAPHCSKPRASLVAIAPQVVPRVNMRPVSASRPDTARVSLSKGRGRRSYPAARRPPRHRFANYGRGERAFALWTGNLV